MAIPTIATSAFTSMASAGTSLNASIPGGSAGDLLFAHLWAGGTIGTPSGWTLIRAQGESTFGSGESRTYRRQADGSEGATVPFSWTDTMFGTCEVVRITGHNSTTPIDADAGTAGPNSATQTTPSVTTTGPDRLILRCLATDRIAAAPVTPPAGHTERWDENGAVSFDAGTNAGASVGQASAGASGTADFTLSTARPCALQTIAIAGASGGALDLGTATSTSDSAASGLLGLAMAETGAAISHSSLANAILRLLMGETGTALSHSTIVAALLRMAMGESGTALSHSVINAALLRMAMGESGTALSHSAESALLRLAMAESGTALSHSVINAALLRLAMGESGTALSHSVINAALLRLAMGVASTCFSESLLTGDLTVGGEPYAGTCLSHSEANGALHVAMSLAGQSVSRSAASASIRVTMVFSGTIDSDSHLTGDLALGAMPVFVNVTLGDLTPLFSLSDLTGS